MTVWNPETYLKYAGIRFRPALDLIEHIPLERCGRIFDLGCGTRHLTQILQGRWPAARVTGIDSSGEMLSHARSEFPKLDFVQADVRSWRADTSPDLLFSNATFQRVPGHEQLFPSLLAQARPGGVLAIQMPRHIDDPSHLLMLETALDPRWRSRLELHTQRLVVHTPEDYWRWLSPQSSRVDIWETIYQHELDGEIRSLNSFVGRSCGRMCRRCLRPRLKSLWTPTRKKLRAPIRNRRMAKHFSRCGAFS